MGILSRDKDMVPLQNPTFYITCKLKSAMQPLLTKIRCIISIKEIFGPRFLDKFFCLTNIFFLFDKFFSAKLFPDQYFFKNKAFVRLGSCNSVQTKTLIFKYANWPRLQIKRTGPSSWSVQLIHPAGPASWSV